MPTRTLIFSVLLLMAFPTFAQQGGDPAASKLMSVLNRFGKQSVFSLVDVANEERFGRKDNYRVEVWKKGVAGQQTIAMFVLAPENERGMGLLIQESQASPGGQPIRHMYLPALNRVTEVRGLGRSRLDKRLSGLVGPTLLEIGPDTRATTLAMETLEKVSCRRIRAENSNGQIFEIWLEDSSTPVVRQAVRMDKNGKETQILVVDSIRKVGGQRMEGSGTIIVPKKSTTRFEILEGRILNGSESGPFTIKAFTERAQKLAQNEASSE